MDIAELLGRLESELRALQVEAWSAEAKAWKLRAVDVFSRLMAEDDLLMRQLLAIDFSPYIRPAGVQYMPSGWKERFEAGRRDALGIIDAVRHRLELDASGLTVRGGDSLARLHADIQRSSAALYADDHYESAIFEAFKAVEVRVRNLSGTDHSGRDLMVEAFHEDRGVLRLNRSAGRFDKDEQEGFRLIYMGVMQGIRNPKAHDTIIQRDPDRTLDYLSLASLLMRRLDDAESLKT